jgi:hypothetical protein
MEAISPELVLVDPELARAERARLVERARVTEVIGAEALRLAVERTLRSEVDEEPSPERERVSSSPSRYRRRALEGLLLVSLLANGLVLAVFVLGNGDEGTSRAAFVTPTSPTQTLSATVLSHVPSVAVASGRAQDGRAAVAVPQPLGRAPTKAALERRILELIIRDPRAKLPVNLIDPTTGLAKNNLQVVCQRARVPRSFLCVARLAGGGLGRLLVRYRAARGGRGVFTWVRGT